MINIDEINHAILACDEESWKKVVAEVVSEHKEDTDIADFISQLSGLRSAWCVSYNFRLDTIIRALTR